jgi:mannose-6-phosphate isomerase-like protein (cupin superfamily)
MKVIKRERSDIAKEDAHGGSGQRKVYASPEHLKSTAFEMMTHGFMPAGGMYDWHDHTDIEEIMVVVKGTGLVHDEDGEYPYEPGDVFVFPANIQHKISNPGDTENEFIFVRVKV